MPFRRFFLFMLFVLLSSFLILAGCTVGTPEDRVRTELITVVFVVTATPDPNATPNVIIVTATVDCTQVNVPDNLVQQGTNNAGSASLSGTALPLDLTQAGDSGSNIPETCLTHTVAEGDTVFGIADEYGVNPFVMLEVNGMTEETAFLNIGDELIVPIEGCPIEQLIVSRPTEEVAAASEEVTETVEVTAEATEAANTTPTVTPTITLAPTATDSEIEIMGIISAGDVTAEGVRIRNNGRVVNVTGWVLSDADGNSYTFPDQMIFSNAELTLYTRTGQDVPVSRFWGLQTAVWQPGDVVTLTDADGDVQASYRVPANP